MRCSTPDPPRIAAIQVHVSGRRTARPYGAPAACRHVDDSPSRHVGTSLCRGPASWTAVPTAGSLLRRDGVERLSMSVGRLEAFSDGVLAIVITLLILDVKVPGSAEGHLGRELAQQWPQYVAYLVSF